MDGLSAAASVAGIASLAVQLAESVTKLCKFLSAIKHASDDIEDIIDDLEVLTCVIAEIQRCEELFGPQHATAKTIMRCRRQVQALENMVKTLNEELEKDSKWRRNHAALKAVMKGGKVKAMREKIGEAKDTLSLALQASSSRVQHTQLFAVMRLEGQMGQLGGQASQIQALVTTSSRIGDQPSSSTRLNAISTSSNSVVAASNSLSTSTSAALSRSLCPET
ncbi:hypothetical protein GTA08_BOTSDO00129 [Neofusicoccum parvum]|uniref:Uncharacterized protein n=1 Tax=Neofusicoccum parvum TaxID=310453 RepID=A0ACB5S2N1_9PEZI|nr:hypothetical protein GTA08_BOTSDO00129 [Neofusicoccum parvum]